MRLFNTAAAVGCTILFTAFTANAFDSTLYACPASCHGLSESWTVYTSMDRLRACTEPMLLDFALGPALDSSESVITLFTCSSTVDNSDHLASSSETTIPSTCFSSQERTASLDFKMKSTPGSVASSELHTVLDHVQHFLANTSHCNTTSIFGYYNGVAVGIFSGSAIDNAASIPSVVQALREHIPKDQIPESIIIQRCSDVPNADYIFGLAVDTTGDLAAVQKSVSSWSRAQCVDSSGESSKLKNGSIFEKSLEPTFDDPSTLHTKERLSRRGDCRTIKVVPGDSCGSLASRCGISGNDFEKYNQKQNLCSTLAPGQPVCCSPGGLPDIQPQQNADGSCASYKVQPRDTCSAIAASHGLTPSNISDFNDGKTWGWFGCDDKNLRLGLNICLSTGDPPLPAPVSNAQCGPTVPGTRMPTNGTKLEDLNQCPLNSCCDIWGQCGITPEYCTNVTGPLGNPGTAPKGQNGCISNCGTNITNNFYSPNGFMKVGYYESWNWDRPCLNMRAIDVGVIEYSHVHWAFATITDDFDVAINDTYNQWQGFLNLYGVHRIISFGGWGYSTSPSTYDKLREAMDPANVNTFVQNIYHFVERNGLDGVDFDWEYPGAPDIPGIPAGLESDGPNYLNFLKNLKLHFPITKSISIAAPASYWYLKAFPIEEMSKQLDYIVYMTYDLHGQWDYGNAWSQDGCPSGNCLRSQGSAPSSTNYTILDADLGYIVNLTETEYALAMISKAGVDTNMIVVGVPTYGRSFGMAQESCTGPNCHFTGNSEHSTATPGRCTQTAGIIANAEINEILALGTQEKTYFDPDSDSNVIVYNGTWASFMDHDTINSRADYYKNLNFAGTVEWAADLQAFGLDDGNPTGAWDEPVPPKLSECTSTFDSLEALGEAHGSIPEHCVTPYTVKTLENLLTVAMNNYTDMINNGYDEKFKTYADAVAGNAASSVHDFMYQNGDKYFSCEVVESATCCSFCESQPDNPDNCRYCWTDGDCYHMCTGIDCSPGNFQQANSRDFNVSEPCPPDYSKRGSNYNHQETVYWSLPDDKADQFYKAIYADTGIDKSHLEFGNYDRGCDCTPGNTIGDGDSCWDLGMDFNIPVPNGFDASDVANPKKTAQRGLDRSGNLHPQMLQSLFQLATDTWVGDGMDLIDSISMPILMVVQAVEEMSKVVNVANQITKAEEEAIIAAFLGALLFMVPIAGEILGSVEELADVGAVLTLAGEAGNVAMGVADVVKDPHNAPLAIMNLIFVPGALADVARVAKAARIRRAMKPEDITKLGAKVSSRLESIKKVTGKCVP